MGELLPEILEQILLRLDVEDIIRCKGVCKSWESFISGPDFVKVHLKHSYDNDRNDNEIGERRIVMPRILPNRNNFGEYEFDDDLFDSSYCHLIGSSNGLVCISPNFNEVLVANPSTREVKKLPNPKIQVGSLCWGFGFDSSIDDYKVIIGFKKGEDLTGFKVLTLKSNEWKVIGDVNYTFVSRIGVLCNGGLHWVMSATSSQNKKKAILSFDISTEEFIEIPQPDAEIFELMARYPSMRLGTIDECLCVFLRELLPRKLWIMKKYNEKQSWEMVHYHYEIKNEVVHFMKVLKHYIPHKRSLCRTTWFIKSWEFIGSPIFVQSLVSPHAQKKMKKKRVAIALNSTRSRRRVRGDPSVAEPSAGV